MHQVKIPRAAELQRGHSLTRHHTAGSFVISEDTKPRVINLDFPTLPSGNGRSEKLIENGVDKPMFDYATWKLTFFRCLPRLCS